MGPAVFAAMFALAGALTLAGVVVALSMANVAKKLAGLVVALLGACAAAAALGAPEAVLIAAAAAGFGYVSLGAALLVRLQEDYRSIEIVDIDRADREDDLPEPRS